MGQQDNLEQLERFVGQLTSIPAVVAVVLGGSLATGTHRPDSDWDFGLYYKGLQQTINPADIGSLRYEGHVVSPGEWGPIVNGGAWLKDEGYDVDVLYRELDVVEHWVAEAEAGRFEVPNQAGYLVGAPTYVLVGELALCRVLYGNLPRPSFPQALRESALNWWLGNAAFSLLYADIYAGQGDSVGCAGMLARAVLGVSHARLEERGVWVLNEKYMVERSNLHQSNDILAAVGSSPEELRASVKAMRNLLGLHRPTGPKLDEVVE